MESIEGRLVGSKGAHRIYNTEVKTGLDYTIIIAESDTVFNTIEGQDEQGEAVDFTASPFGWENMTAGIPYAVPMGHKITDITLTSGAVVCY